jgi:hypothetical protein
MFLTQRSVEPCTMGPVGVHADTINTQTILSQLLLN